MTVREFTQRRIDLTIGILLAVLGAFVFLPYLGSFPLWDPWEPHYSQVAWEMRHRHTWLEPYYRNTDNWWSKPILMLWLLRISFGLFWDDQRAFSDHELYARLPFALAAIAGVVVQYDWVRRLFGRLVGLLAAIALMTSAQYVLIGRQVMADMVLVVTYSGAMGYLGVALFTKRDQPTASSSVLQRIEKNGPLLAFWSLLALAVLAKGFVPPVLTALVLCSYGVVTFRAYEPIRARSAGSCERCRHRRALAAMLLATTAALAVYWCYRHASWSKEQRQLAVAGVAVLGLAIGVLGVFGNSTLGCHSRALLTRIGAVWGIPLFLAIAAPWYLYMTVSHGWPYWHQFIFFHHLGRAAGEINLPAGTFDFYLRSLGFALFPWTGLLVGGLFVFLARCHPLRQTAERRNLYVLCLVAAPTTFFMLSGTKFAHYVFPVIPACTVIVATGLVWLMRRGEPWVALDEGALCTSAAAVELAPDTASAQRERTGSVALLGWLSLLVFGVLLSDVRHDVRHLLRLFVYYFNRTTPFEYHSAGAFTWMGLPIVAICAWIGLSRMIRREHLIALCVCAIGSACYLGWVTMPAMGATYSYKPVYDAYRQCAKPGDSVGQYNNWPQPERSVMFLFQNRAAHLNSDAAATFFLGNRGRKFIIVDRNRLSDLRRVAKQLNAPLYVVFDDHPYARLVSNEPEPAPKRTSKPYVLGELPAGATSVDANFAGKIRLLGWKATPETLSPGQSVTVSFFFEPIAPIEKDWRILVHADSPTTAGHRLIADHDPANGRFPTRNWQEGRIIEDQFAIPIPLDYPFESFFVWTGFFIGEERMPLANSPPNDGKGRVRGPLVTISRPERQP